MGRLHLLSTLVPTTAASCLVHKVAGVRYPVAVIHASVTAALVSLAVRRARQPVRTSSPTSCCSPGTQPLLLWVQAPVKPSVQAGTEPVGQDLIDLHARLGAALGNAGNNPDTDQIALTGWQRAQLLLTQATIYIRWQEQGFTATASGLHTALVAQHGEERV